MQSQLWYQRNAVEVSRIQNAINAPKIKFRKKKTPRHAIYHAYLLVDEFRVHSELLPDLDVARFSIGWEPGLTRI